MMYKDYEPELLASLQEVEIGLLKDFHDYCSSHGISYFICGGTLLGAVRHGGFIPWDDDLDVGMTREDYDRFLQACEEEPDPDHKILNFKVDNRFPVMITKWYKKGTRFRDEDAVTCGYDCGIAVDIFCFDNVADSEKDLRKQAMKAWVFGKLLILRQIANPTVYAGGWKGKLLKLASAFLHGLTLLCPLPASFFYNRAEEAVTRYRGERTERVAFLFDPTPYTSILLRKDIHPVQEMTFGPLQVLGPRHPEVYLKRRYGKSYMLLPPEESRHNHPPVDFSLGNEEN